MHRKFIRDKILEMGRRKDNRTVFEDFVICLTYAISNGAYYRQSIEEQYLAIAKKYKKQEMNTFAEMMAHLVLEYSKENPQDILGELYEELGLSNPKNGQFFTSEDICDLMTEITLKDIDITGEINKNGYVRINDPACGSGRTLLSALRYLKKSGINLNQVYVEGNDISLLCVCMTYLNLALAGASGVVKHQNTLTQEVYSAFYTPQYIYNKELHENMQKSIKDTEMEEM